MAFQLASDISRQNGNDADCEQHFDRCRHALVLSQFRSHFPIGTGLSVAGAHNIYKLAPFPAQSAYGASR